MIRFALLALAAVTCSPTPAPVSPAPPDTTTVVVISDGGSSPYDACDWTCAHLRELGCPDGRTTAGGVSCENVCREDRADPVARLTPRYLSCLASIRSCSEETSCVR